MKNYKMHKTAAFLALAVIGAFFLGIINMSLEDKLLNVLALKWVLIAITGYAAFVFHKLLNF
jgi:hypothetical protein